MTKVDVISNADFSRPVATGAGPQATSKSEQQAVSAIRQTDTVGGKPSPLQEVDKQQAEPSKEAVESAVEEISNYVQSVSRDLQFSIDEDLGKTIVTVLNDTTQEVIRQIPSEELVELAKRLDNQAKGALVSGVLLNSEA